MARRCCVVQAASRKARTARSPSGLWFPTMVTHLARRTTLITALIVLAACATVLLLASESQPGSAVSIVTSPEPTRTAPPSLWQMLGQRIMIGFGGPNASAQVLARIRRGEVGSVILFTENIRSLQQVRRLTRSLQRAAAAGGNPPLLIAVDQEGSTGVKRFQNAPPYLTPPQLTATGNPTKVERIGFDTGRFLRKAGVNWNLAPVVDVPTSSNSFIRKQGRAFSADPRKVATFGGAFARGVQRAAVAATAKHFPGVGSLTIDTDFRLLRVNDNSTQRAEALLPYRRLIADGVDTIMLATAIYPAYDPNHPAALSSAVIGGLLRQELGFGGVTITDGLGSPTGYSEQRAGLVAAQAGADVLLYTNGAPGVLARLMRAATNGQLTSESIMQSYQRIIALKRKIG